MRYQVFEILGGDPRQCPQQLVDDARAFEKQYNTTIADPLLDKLIPYLTPTFQKVCSALLGSPTLITLTPSDAGAAELIPRTLPAACVGCGKEFKGSIPVKGAEFFIIHHADATHIQAPGQYTYPTHPVGFWACTKHAALIHTIHKCIHFMTHLRRDLERLIPPETRATSSWESLVGPVYSKRPFAKWPVNLKDNAYPVVTSIAIHRRTLQKGLEPFVQVLTVGPQEKPPVVEEE